MPENTDFTYSKNSYSQSESNPTPLISGESFGVFQCDDSNIVIDPIMGTIYLSNSQKGNYVIKYVKNNEFSTFNLEII
tara:strand:- start:224 stop:457 length:234 start_codon:yes stop_codon:yes gene_type:complete